MYNIKKQTARWAALCLALAGLQTGSGRAATFFQENFDAFADNAAVTTAGWTINDNSATAESDWTILNPGSRRNPNGSTGKFMISDDDQGSPDDASVDEELITPAINLSTATTVWLHFATLSEPNDDGSTVNNVDISSDNGVTWTTVWSSASPAVGTASTFDTDGVTVIDGNSDGRTTPVHVNISAQAAGKAALKVRFHHLQSTDDWYWIVDNVVVDDTPPFAGGADVLLANEGFEGDTFPPTGWEVIRNSPLPDQNNPWMRDDGGAFRNANGTSGRNFVNRLSPDHFAILDSDFNPDADPEDETLRTPIINASEYAKLYLHLDSEMKFNIGKTLADIEVSGDGGTSWSTLYSYDYRLSPPLYRSGEVYYDNFVLDASVAAGSSTVTFRFRYRGNGDEWWWAIDNVKVSGTKGVVVVQQPPAKPVLTAPTSVSFFDTSLAFSGSAFSDPNVGNTLASSIWQFSTTPDFNENSGLASVQQEVTQTGPSTSLSTALGFVTPGATVYATHQYVDSTGLKSKFSDVKTFTVSALPTPFAFENFEAPTEPFTIPVGWTATNDTTVLGADPDPASLSSATYHNWVVVPFESLSAFGNPADGRGRGPVDGQSIYAESDTRGGTQIQVLTTPDFNATGKQNVWLVFKSNYVQNQDNINGLEYSVNEGATWLPLLYMIDRADVITLPAGGIDGEATLSAVRGDQAAPSTINPDTGEVTRTAASYGTFILARPLSALGPFISGRVNDDKFESKRIERFRLAAADNAAKVRFRFVQAGTASWWWGVDDFGLYEGPSAVTGINISATAGPSTINLTWTGGSGKFLIQRKADLNSATWMNLLSTTDRSATVVKDLANGFFRIIDNYTGPDVIQLSAYLTVDAETTAITGNPTGSGIATVSLEGADKVNYLVTYTGLTTSGTGVGASNGHIHQQTGDSTTSGGVVSGFTPGPSGTSGYVTGQNTISAAVRQAILDGKTYVNIHTGVNGSGELRGQILRTKYVATLSGANQVPAVTTSATGNATIEIYGNELRYNVSFTGLQGGNAAAAHIHGRASTTANAGVLFGFPTVPAATSGTISGVGTANTATRLAIVDGLAYVNIHTPNLNGGNGEIRGQLTPAP